MKKYITFLIVIFLTISCKNDKDDVVQPVKKPEPIVYDFGFKLNDFSVVRDTIRKDDTFGSILEKQNLNGKQVHEVIAKVKDTFNVRIMRLGKPYTMLRTKDKFKKLQYFIYQPESKTKGRKRYSSGRLFSASFSEWKSVTLYL